MTNNWSWIRQLFEYETEYDGYKMTVEAWLTAHFGVDGYVKHFRSGKDPVYCRFRIAPMHGKMPTDAAIDTEIEYAQQNVANYIRKH